MRNTKPLPFFISIGLILLFALSGSALFAQVGADLFETGAEVPAQPSPFFDWRLDLFNIDFFVRLGINLLTMIILIRGIYYKVYGRRDFFFTFFMFNTVIFIITFLLNSNSGFSIGAAFGLFAIFAMLRYRTEDISTRDMTYLFLSITIGLISSINKGTILELLIINAIIVAGAYLLEGNLILKPEFFKVVEYEKIELVTPEKREELIADLKNRTGLEVHKVYVKRLDFLRDTAILKIYYYNPRKS